MQIIASDNAPKPKFLKPSSIRRQDQAVKIKIKKADVKESDQDMHLPTYVIAPINQKCKLKQMNWEL